MAHSDVVISCEIGGTKLQAAVGTREGTILHRLRGQARAEEGARALLAWFEGALPQLRAQAKAEGAAVSGIGVGFGGPVETATGRALVSHQVSGWDGVAVRSWFEETFGLPSSVHNDANMAGWAEYCCGAGRGTKNFCYMNIGSGIGGAFVIDGALYDGQGFGAAEIGHTYVPDWTSQTPGACDKLERLCSGWAIERRVRGLSEIPKASVLWELSGGKQERISCPMIGDAARGGDAFAKELIEDVAKSLGIGLSNVITLLHPERIAMGGGVSLMGDVLLEPLRRNVAERVFGPYRGRYEIVPCALGEDVVVVGGLLLAG